jgi:zinc and cadmium transporter
MTVLLVVDCLLIAMASLMGGWLATRIRLTHRRIQLVLSFVGGVMLGVALLHLLPHALRLIGRAEVTMGIALAGLLFMFVMIRLFDFHQHDIGAQEGHGDGHDHHHDHDRSHVSSGSAGPGKRDAEKRVAASDSSGSHGVQGISWAGFFFGLAVHSIIDGMALAAAITAEWHAAGWLAGASIFLAIGLHKPLDAMAITSLMKARGTSPDRQAVVNVIFSLMCPIGALLLCTGLVWLSGGSAWWLGAALAFAAGAFLCIALGDLLPEVQFHSHDRLALSAMLLAGIGLSVATELLPGHSHAPAPVIDRAVDDE